MATYLYKINGAEKTVQIEPGTNGYQVRIGEKNYSVDLQNATDNVIAFTVDGLHRRAYIGPSTELDVRQIWSNGGQWSIEKVDARKRRQRSSVRSESGALTASMPGQVLEVLVAEGDEVNKGDTLVILEAMKMEMRVSATVDGKVETVKCKNGDVVKRGQTLVVVGGA